MLLALVDTEDRFLWVDGGSSRYSSNAQLLTQVEEEDQGWHLGEGGQDVHYFLLGDDAFVLMPLMVKPNSRRQLTREEKIANYMISRDRGLVANPFGILVSRFRVPLGTMEQRLKVVRNKLPYPGDEEAGIYQSFSGLINYSKKFYLSWCCFQQINKKSNTFQQVFKQLPSKSQVP